MLFLCMFLKMGWCICYVLILSLIRVTLIADTLSPAEVKVSVWCKVFPNITVIMCSLWSLKALQGLYRIRLVKSSLPCLYMKYDYPLRPFFFSHFSHFSFLSRVLKLVIRLKMRKNVGIPQGWNAWGNGLFIIRMYLFNCNGIGCAPKACSNKGWTW